VRGGGPVNPAARAVALLSTLAANLRRRGRHCPRPVTRLRLVMERLSGRGIRPEVGRG
jgi:hypothetical protein